MATTVMVNIDGVVNHSHVGVSRWHDPAGKHPRIPTIHESEKASQPTNLKDLDASKRAQYAKALAGTSFQHLWRAGRDARKGLHEANQVVAAAEQITPQAAAERDMAEFPLELR